MSSPGIEGLTERMELLERECRWWRRCGVVTAVSLAVALVVGAAREDQPPKSIRAESFSAVDSKGREVIGIRTNPEGGGQVEFFNLAGKRRLLLALDPIADPTISLNDADGLPRISLEFDANLGYGLSLRDKESRRDMIIASSPDGVTGIGLVDKEGNPRLDFGISPRGTARFTVRDKEGKALFHAP